MVAAYLKSGFDIFSRGLTLAISARNLTENPIMSNSPDVADMTPSPLAPADMPSGVILAGGSSRRMGQDKALLKVGERTLLDVVVMRTTDQLFSLALAGGPEAWARARGVDHVADAILGGRGPLAGLVAAMDFAAQSGSQSRFVFVTATDMPFLPADLVMRLVEQCGKGLPVIPRYEGRLQPLAALWPNDLRDKIALGLGDSSARSMKDVYEASGFVEVVFEIEDIDPFFNVNTPEDLENVRQILARDS